MALTIAVVVSFIALANAGYVWMDEGEHTYQPFQPIKMPNIQFPSIRLPRPPRLPTPPQFPKGFPFSGFHVPFIQLPNIPTPGEMANVKPGPNQVYHGVAVKSKSGFTVDKDGNTVRTGGTTFMVNDNGEVLKHESGDNPPDLNEPIVFPMPKMPEFKMPVFKPFVMPPMRPIIPIKPVIIDPSDIENHIPDENEHFVGVSTSSFTHSESVNGVETSGGGSSTMVNNNGEVEKEALVFGKGDKE